MENPLKELSIKRFKSIKELNLDCKRVNLFIGEPNTGKSNILEGLSVFSLYSKMNDLARVVRFKKPIDLFHNLHKEEPVAILAKLENGTEYNFSLKYTPGASFRMGCSQKSESSSQESTVYIMDLGPGGTSSNKKVELPEPLIKRYIFLESDFFPAEEFDYLLHPHGDNLAALLKSDRHLTEIAASFLEKSGYRLQLRPDQTSLEIVQKKSEDFLTIALPYTSLADTLQRVIFYTAAIEKNKDSIIVLEEPENYAFPYYTKYIAEKIARDSNQYFISTHNPYFLAPIIEKTEKDQVQIFITCMEDYETRVKVIGEEDLSKIIEEDREIFLNLQKYIEAE